MRNMKLWLPLFIGLLLFTGCESNPTPATTGYSYTWNGIRITAFDLPTPDSNPYGITTGPDGNLWVTSTLREKSAHDRIGGKREGAPEDADTFTQTTSPEANEFGHTVAA